MSSTPPWANKSLLNNQKDEQDWAKRRGGVTQPNSGRMWHRKGDTRDEEFLSDTKQTLKASYTITKSDWEKLSKDARKEGRLPLLKITFVTSDGVVELAVVPAEYLG